MWSGRWIGMMQVSRQTPASKGQARQCGGDLAPCPFKPLAQLCRSRVGPGQGGTACRATFRVSQLQTDHFACTACSLQNPGPDGPSSSQHSTAASLPHHDLCAEDARHWVTHLRHGRNSGVRKGGAGSKGGGGGHWVSDYWQ